MGIARNEWVPTAKGLHLRGRRSTHTEPELLLRRELHRRGLRFRLHRRLAPGCNPDLVLPKHRIAVWVDGCYWHGHDHSPPPSSGPNAALWAAKIDANRARDARASARAALLGWKVVRLWECAIKQDVRRSASLVAELVPSRD